MDQKTYEEAKKNSEEIAKLLREGNLTAQEKQKLETLQTQLAGVLAHPWLPFGWGRRLIIIIMLLFAGYGLTEGSYHFLLVLLLLPFFSPRCVGEFSYVLGNIFRGSH